MTRRSARHEKDGAHRDIPHSRTDGLDNVYKLALTTLCRNVLATVAAQGTHALIGVASDV